MEVLHGNYSNVQHRRRSSDKAALRLNRTLDWGSLESDIQLHPHSPLDLLEALSGQNTFLDLIPKNSHIIPACSPGKTEAGSLFLSSEHTADSRQQNTLVANAAPLPSKAENTSSIRFNLLTQHNQKELLSQCKKLLVENALIKNKGDQQLYLAVGFIKWVDTSASDTIKRAPLLLYPALLVRATEEARYEIRLSGEAPEFNQLFATHARQKLGLNIPEFDHKLSLNDYLPQVAQYLRSQRGGAELEFAIALGSASLQQHAFHRYSEHPLPAIPDQFDAGLALRIAGNKSLSQLSAILQLIPSYLQSNTTTADSNAPTQAHENVADLRKYAARLAAEGLQHIEFRQLPQLPSRIKKWIDAVSMGMQTSTVSTLLKTPDITSRELIKLAGIIELIDKAPDNIATLGHPDLCYANTAMLLRRALHQAKLIEDELEALQAHFVLEKVPSKSKLLSLMAELRGSLENGPDLVGADYFNARRQFMEFSTEKPSNLTTEHRRLLSQLAKVLRFRELFVNNTEYRTAFGPGYRGLRTHWNQLLQVCDYARELADVLESESIAASIVQQWGEFRKCYTADLEQLLNAADANRRLLIVAGKRWQTQSVSELISHANTISTRLETWQINNSWIENHGNKTAAGVLSSFSGQSLDDVVIEMQVDEARNHINQKLHAGEVNREQITETLRWLTDANQIAIDHDLDIDAIVDRLPIV